VDEKRARFVQPENIVDVEWWRRIGIEQRSNLAVALDVEGEVVRAGRLTFGHRSNERVFAHGSQRVVRAALLADCGAGLARELLPARRACAMPWIDTCRVRKHQQLVAQRA